MENMWLRNRASQGGSPGPVVGFFFFKENLDPLNSFEQESDMIRIVLTDQKSEHIKKRRGWGRGHLPSVQDYK